MNFDLSDEQKLLQENIFESAGKLNNASSFSERWKYLAKTGIIGISVDESVGGSGLGALEMLLALESLARGNADNGLSFAVAAHTLACVIPVNKYGSQVQKQKYLPGLINGEMLAANAMTESESGSEVFNLQCKAEKNSSGYILNGTKTFVSNSADADLVLTYASTNKEKGFFGGITAFIVEKGKYKTGSHFRKMGLESCSLGEIVFDNVALTAENIFPELSLGA